MLLTSPLSPGMFLLPALMGGRKPWLNSAHRRHAAPPSPRNRKRLAQKAQRLARKTRR